MTIKVFYNPAQNVTDVTASPSAGKPILVAEAFRAFPGVEIVSDFEPLTISEMSAAHAREHVELVLRGRTRNGFGNTLESVAKSLPWTTGSFYRAAQYALHHQTVTMSPTSGFHHAGFASCEGYCTFNGLMIAANLLRRTRIAPRIGIVDFDAHYGNGTDEIIEELGITSIEHMTFGSFAYRVTDFDKWLDTLRAELMGQFRECDILFYQAGADPHIDDPLGGFLTTEQMRRRDRIVFEVAAKMRVPMVWNLAGGYQRPIEKVVQLHVNTLEECLAVSKLSRSEAQS